MNDKQQLAAMGEHMREMEDLQAQVENLTSRLAWRNTGSPNGLRRFMTQKQYDEQTPGIKKWYEPIRYEVPEDWQLVPKVLTPEMNDAAFKSQGSQIDWGDIDAMYRAMLAAAPECKP